MHDSGFHGGGLHEDGLKAEAGADRCAPAVVPCFIRRATRFALAALAVAAILPLPVLAQQPKPRVEGSPQTAPSSQSAAPSTARPSLLGTPTASAPASGRAIDVTPQWSRRPPTPASAAASPGRAKRPKRPVALRIATWNLAGSITGKITSKFAPRAKPIWRTTFGPPKTASAGPVGAPPNVAADIIALQSVTDLRVVRRLFPARDYHIIVSRQLLALGWQQDGRRGGRVPRGDETLQPQQGTAAIVIARKAGLRMSRQEQLLGFARSFSAARPAAGAAGPQAAGSATPVHRSAALALRFRKNRHNIWVISLDLTWDCPSAAARTSANATASASPESTAPPAAKCRPISGPDRADQLAQLRRWIKAKRGKGDLLFIAGSFNKAVGSHVGSSADSAAGDGDGIAPQLIAFSAGAALPAGALPRGGAPQLAAKVPSSGNKASNGWGSSILSALSSSPPRRPPGGNNERAPSASTGGAAIGAATAAQPAKRKLTSCAKTPQAAKDGILLDGADDAARAAEITKHTLEVRGARHCPLILDVRF